MSSILNRTEITSPQTRDLPVTRNKRELFCYRYASARSRDIRKADGVGRDFLAIREDSLRLAFALCDGVSQSFFSDLAARLLGEALLDWFWERTAPTSDETSLKGGLSTLLQSLPGPVTIQVLTYAIPDETNDELRNEWEEKRAQGSQSTFIAGLLDWSANRLLLAWMGESRLRLWHNPNEEITQQLGSIINPDECWSSLKGPLGELHTVVLPMSPNFSLAVYSDGLSRLDPAPVHQMSDRAIQEYMTMADEAPVNDDLSLLQVWLGAPPPVVVALPDPHARLIEQAGSLLLDWQPVAGANAYEIKCLPEPVRRLGAKKSPVKIPEEWRTALPCTVQVRGWRGHEPGDWSAVLSLPPLPPSPPPPVQDRSELLVVEEEIVSAQPEAPTETSAPEVTELPEEVLQETAAEPERKRRSSLFLWLILSLIGLGLIGLVGLAWAMGVFPGGKPTPTATVAQILIATPNPFPPPDTATVPSVLYPSPTPYPATFTPVITSSPTITSTSTGVSSPTATASSTPSLVSATPSPTATATYGRRKVTPEPTPTRTKKPG